MDYLSLFQNLTTSKLGRSLSSRSAHILCGPQQPSSEKERSSEAHGYQGLPCHEPGGLLHGPSGKLLILTKHIQRHGHSSALLQLRRLLVCGGMPHFRCLLVDLLFSIPFFEAQPLIQKSELLLADHHSPCVDSCCVKVQLCFCCVLVMLGSSFGFRVAGSLV
jgi:hypothetical protein